MSGAGPPPWCPQDAPSPSLSRPLIPLLHLSCCQCAHSASFGGGLYGASLQLVLPKMLVPTCSHVFPFQVGAGGLSPALHRLGRSLQQAAADALRGERPPCVLWGDHPWLGVMHQSLPQNYGARMETSLYLVSPPLPICSPCTAWVCCWDFQSLEKPVGFLVL